MVQPVPRATPAQPVHRVPPGPLEPWVLLVQLVRQARGAVAEHVRLGAQREGGGAHHERDREYK